MQYIEYLLNAVKKNQKNRKIVIYGAARKCREIKDELLRVGIAVECFVDSSVWKINQPDVYEPEILNGYAHKYYVIVPLIKTPEIIEKLRRYGFSEHDYVYLGNIPYSILHDSDDYFEDSYGNKIIFEQNEEKRKSRINCSGITFCGFNSKVIIPTDCKIASGFRLHMNSNAVFKVGSGSYLDGKFCIDNNGLFQCGRQCGFEANGSNWVYSAKIEIGDGFTTEPNVTIYADCASIFIGDDCMVSKNVTLRTHDGHSIFDMETGKRINHWKRECGTEDIRIGNHVWLGMDSTIMYRSEIEEGSIVGAHSLVKSKFPKHVIIAGIPAKVIRRNVAWSRSYDTFNIDECEFFVGDGKEDKK